MEFREFFNSQAPQPKKWKASKDEIVAYWKNLRPDTPILMNPIDSNHKGSTYGEDGIRITGSPQFIAAVLSRLKDFINFETPGTKLTVAYRETDSPSRIAMGDNKTSYVFYMANKQNK